jgi:ParB family chromosome partitioning protein
MAALTASTNPAKKELNNSGASELAKMRQISTVKTHPDFQSLFTIKEHILKQITESMKAKGYDKSKPIDIWKEEDVLIDGHTRLQAAKDAGLFDVPVYEHSFQSLDEALEYALGVQIARRNLDDAELVAAVGRLDELKTGGRRKAGDGTERGRSSEHLAETLGTNSRKIEKIRAIEREADEETKAAVKSGGMSINRAYQKTKSKPNPDDDNPLSTTYKFKDDDSMRDLSFDDADEETESGISDMDDVFATVDEEDESVPADDDLKDYNVTAAEKFLISAVILLVDKSEFTAAALLIGYFIQKKDRPGFFKKLPQNIRDAIAGEVQDESN